MTLDFSVHPLVGMSGGYHLQWYPLFDGVYDGILQIFSGLVNVLMLLGGEVEISKIIVHALHICPVPEINLSSWRLGACGFN